MTEQTTPPAGENPWARRPVIVSAVVVAAIVVLGLVVGLSNVMGDHDAPPTSGSAPTSTRAPSSSTTVEASVCGLPGGQDSGTVAAAPSATWSLVGTTAVPAAKAAGPGTVDEDGYRSCFAHTPEGAVIAAANLVGLGSHAPVREKFYEGSTVPGPGRDALLEQVAPGTSEGAVRIQIEGFRMLRYTGQQADVDIAVRTSKGAVAGTVLNLQWSGGDWKLRVADDGSELSPTVQLPDLTGYIPWSGA